MAPDSPETLNAQVAQRLFALRESLDLSTAELAARVGVTEAEVLRHEGGNAEIPVSYLFKVAKTCGVDLTELLTGTEAHLSAYTLVRSGNGLAVDRRKDYGYASLAYRFSHRVMEPFLVTVPPKPETAISFNEHPGQEFLYCLTGRLEVRLGKEVLVMEPGDSLYLDATTPHALRGLDETEATFLDVII